MEVRIRTVVTDFAIKICFLYQICGRYIRCYVLPVISDAWVHAYINVQHICTLIRRAGRAGGKSGLCRQKLAQDFSFKIHLFPQNVLQNLVWPTSYSVTFRCFCYLYCKEFSYSCLSSEGLF